MRISLLALLVLGCGDKAADSGLVADTSAMEDEDDEGDERDDCEEVSIKVIGPQPPVLGDEWTVYLNCDEALMTGTTVVRVDPPDFAGIADNVISWTTAGEATLSVQVGSIRLYEDVTVVEAR